MSCGVPSTVTAEKKLKVCPRWPKLTGTTGTSGVPRIRRTPPLWDAGIVQYLGHERSSSVVERAAKRFAMHTADRVWATASQFSTHGRKPFRMEHEAEYVARAVWRPPVEQHRKEARRRAVGRDDVPLPVHDNRGKGLLLLQDRIDGGTDGRKLAIVEG